MSSTNWEPLNLVADAKRAVADAWATSASLPTYTMKGIKLDLRAESVEAAIRTYLQQITEADLRQALISAAAADLQRKVAQLRRTIGEGAE